MSALLPRLNALYAAHADALNPHGWAHMPHMREPASLEELAARLADADSVPWEARIAFAPRYAEAFPGVDMAAFFAAHDRIHVALNAPFTMRGECAVVKAQRDWLAQRSVEAARLHARLVASQGVAWRNER